MTPFEKLDAVLKLLSESNNAQIEHSVPIARLDLAEIINFLENDTGNHISLNAHELTLIMAKLTKDGYVYLFPSVDGIVGWDGNVDRWQISFEGDIFIQDGGYTTATHRKNLEDRNAKRISYLMIWGTWIAGIGTLILALVEILKKVYPKAQIHVFSINLLTSLFLFGSGILVGLCIWLIILELSKKVVLR